MEVEVIHLRQVVRIDAYSNEETKRLDREYDISTYVEEETIPITISRDRDRDVGEIATRFLSYSKKAGKIVGLNRTEFERELPKEGKGPIKSIEYLIDDLIRNEYFDQELEEGEERVLVIYPTEKLLENHQGVKKRQVAD